MATTHPYATLMPGVLGLRMRDLGEAIRRRCIRRVTGCHRTVTDTNREPATGIRELPSRASHAGAVPPPLGDIDIIVPRYRVTAALRAV